MDHSPLPPSPDPSPDRRLDRRGLMRCMAWAGTGLLWTAGSGVLSSKALAQGPAAAPPAGGGATAKTLDFVQISDTHMGFKKPAKA